MSTVDPHWAGESGRTIPIDAEHGVDSYVCLSMNACVVQLCSAVQEKSSGKRPAGRRAKTATGKATTDWAILVLASAQRAVLAYRRRHPSIEVNVNIPPLVTTSVRLLSPGR